MSISSGEVAILKYLGKLEEEIKNPPLLTLGTLNRQGELLDVYGKGQQFLRGDVKEKVYDDVLQYYSAGQAGRIITGRESESSTPVGIVPHAAPVDATSWLYWTALPIQFVEELYDVVNGTKYKKGLKLFQKDLNRHVSDALHNAWSLELKSKNRKPPSPPAPTTTTGTQRGASSYSLGISDSFNTYNLDLGDERFINHLENELKSSRNEANKANRSHISSLRKQVRSLEGQLDRSNGVEDDFIKHLKFYVDYFRNGKEKMEEKYMGKEASSIITETELRKKGEIMNGMLRIAELGNNGNSSDARRINAEANYAAQVEQTIGYGKLLGKGSYGTPQSKVERTIDNCSGLGYTKRDEIENAIDKNLKDVRTDFNT